MRIIEIERKLKVTFDEGLRGSFNNMHCILMAKTNCTVSKSTLIVPSEPMVCNNIEPMCLRKVDEKFLQRVYSIIMV